MIKCCPWWALNKYFLDIRLTLIAPKYNVKVDILILQPICEKSEFVLNENQSILCLLYL